MLGFFHRACFKERVTQLHLQIRGFGIPGQGFLIAAQCVIPSFVFARHFTQGRPWIGSMGIGVRSHGEVGNGTIAITQITLEFTQERLSF